MNFFKLQIRNGATGENLVEECIKDNRITTSFEYGKEFIDLVNAEDVVLVHSGKNPRYLVRVLYKIKDQKEINGESFGHDFKVEVLSEFNEGLKAQLFDGVLNLGPQGTFTHLKNPSKTRDIIIKWYEHVTNEKVTLKRFNDIEMNDSILKEQSDFPLNEILYGPPGTGKTFETKSKAVEIITGKHISDRDELNAIYKQLVESNNIMFSTFHQSMSYEDFVEGIKPITTEGQVSYDIQDGIFKQISSLAKGVNGRIEKQENSIDFGACDFYKMSLGGKNRQDVHNWCLNNSVIALGYGGNKDLSIINASGLKDYQLEFQEHFPDLVEKTNYHVVATHYFKNLLKVGDVVLISKGNKILDAVGIVTGNYEYRENEEIPYHHFRSVRWIATDMNADPSLFVDKNISQQTIYQFYNDDIKVDYFEKKFTNSNKEQSYQNHVLIIDEINRGNVSAIFGELITLIEEDKRLGAAEEIKVTLPYSKEEFGIPNNLYIIGTMNTADRSVEALDTALRRRFSFKEVGPDPDLIEKVGKADKGAVEGIELVPLLETINKRIEVLLDKDHCIGHSYFLKVKTLEDLKQAFMNKIIPLLQEYFFGDYGKIGLVLGKDFVKQKKKGANIFASFEEYDASMFEDRIVYTIEIPENFKEAIRTLLNN